MQLPHVFVGHLHHCQFGSLCRRASRVILGHVDPHHFVRLQGKCLSGRGHCMYSGRRQASLDRTRTMPRDFITQNVFVPQDDIRMRQFSIVWTRPQHPQLFRCTRSDVSWFGHLRVSIAMLQALSAKASAQRRCRTTWTCMSGSGALSCITTCWKPISASVVDESDPFRQKLDEGRWMSLGPVWTRVR